jgi:hypothetical protein
MYFLQSGAKYTEAYDDENGHTYTFSVVCHRDETVTKVTVPGGGLFQYNNGAFVQDAFPDLSSEDRETLMTGLCHSCQTKVFAEEEEF